MKKFTVVERIDTELVESAYFAETSAELKKASNFVAITKTERVKHPSPDVMQRVVLVNFLDKKIVSLEEFYAQCETMQIALDIQASAPAVAVEESKEV